MQIRVEGLQNIGEMVNPRQYRAALNSALNKTARAVRTEASRTIRLNYAVKAKLIKRRTYLKRSTVRDLSAAVWFGGRALETFRFPVSRPGVRGPWVRIKRGRRESFPDSFSYERYGKRFLWQRSNRARPRNPRRSQGLVDPVRDQGISIANMATENLNAILRRRNQAFNTNLTAELRYRARRNR